MANVAESYQLAVDASAQLDRDRHAQALRDCVAPDYPFAGMIRTELERLGIDWRRL